MIHACSTSSIAHIFHRFPPPRRQTSAIRDPQTNVLVYDHMHTLHLKRIVFDQIKPTDNYLTPRTVTLITSCLFQSFKIVSIITRSSERPEALFRA